MQALLFIRLLLDIQLQHSAGIINDSTFNTLVDNYRDHAIAKLSDKELAKYDAMLTHTIKLIHIHKSWEEY